MKWKHIYILGALLFFVSSCGLIHIEKRRYTKGYHIRTTKKLANKNIETTPNNQVVQLAIDTIQHVSLKKNIIEPSRKNLSVEPIAQQQFKSSSRIRTKSKQSKQKITTPSKTFIDKTFTQNIAKTNSSNETQDFWALSFFLLSLMPLVLVGKYKRKKMAIWAARNPKKAQRIIIGSNFIILFTAPLLGLILPFTVAPWMLVMGLGLMAMSMLSHWKSKQSGKNGIKRFFTSLFQTSGAFNLFAVGANGYLAHPKLLLTQGLSGPVSDDPHVFGTVAIILLTILLVLFLVGTIALGLYLGCELACNGQVFLSIIVFTGFPLLGFIGFFRSMYLLYRRESMSPAEMRKKGTRMALTIFGITLGIIGLLLLIGGGL